MSAETNKTVSRRFFEEVFGKGMLSAVDEMFAENVESHGPGTPPGLPDGREGVRQLVMFYRKAFPDTRFTIDEQIAEGNMVVTRWTADGTHRGDLGEIPATGKEATVTGVTIDRFMNGKIVESWGIFDQFGMMQQLGVIPMQAGSQGQGRSQM